MKEDIEEYLRECQARGFAEATVKDYRKRLTQLAAFLKECGKPRFADVVPSDLDEYILELVDRGNSSGTRFSYVCTFRTFFDCMMERGRIVSDPSKDILMPEDEDVPLPTPPLEEAEVAALIDGLPRFDVMDLRNKLHLELLYGCGLRIGESVALNVADLDLKKRTVFIRKGKFGKSRELPMMGGVQGALKDYLALRRVLLRGPDDGALLLSKWTGKRLTIAAFRTWLANLNKRRKTGRRIHPHLFRHSIAVHLLRNGADIRHVQEFLGHADIDTTKIYLRLVPGRLKEDYDKAMPEIAVKASSSTTS